MNIGRKDIMWNYGATFLKIASSILLTPLILKMLPSEDVGIWTVFITISIFSNLFDFGFNPSFARNVSYIFSGATSLKKSGFDIVLNKTSYDIDWGLLKGLISAMRWLYLRISIAHFFLVISLGTYYIHKLLSSYSGNHMHIYIAWFLLCITNTYNLYTLYYDSLLQGRGLVKKSKKIIVLGNLIYLLIASILLLLDFGLISIVFAQMFNTIIVRQMSYKTFFDTKTKTQLEISTENTTNEILNAIYPNAIKIGITVLGSFLIQRSALIIGSLYVSLEELGAYGITIQLISIISSLSVIYTMTYQPKIAQYRIENNLAGIKHIFVNGLFFMILSYVLFGSGLILFGQYFFNLLDSQTSLLPPFVILIATLIAFLESNHSIAGNILLSKNEVPFFKPAIISGLATLVLLLITMSFFSSTYMAMILAPGIVQAVYQNWKWPLEVVRELQLSRTDFSVFLRELKFKL